MNKKLIFPVVDFDGTLAETSKKSPHGIGVLEAYEMAVEDLFGKEGLTAYRDAGGLRNRAPPEVVAELERMGFFISGKTLGEATEALVQAKLKVLLGEINSSWPLPCQGFPEFCQRMTEGYPEWTFAILSSGHRAFIEKTFLVWREEWPWIPIPRLIVSDDELRDLPWPLEERVKPSPKLLQLVLDRLEIGREEAVYVGDDPNKDGLMAVRAGVRFGLFLPNPERTPDIPEEVSPTWTFHDWRDLYL